MAKPHQVQVLNEQLSLSRFPVSMNKLMEVLECSDRTVLRIINEMKSTYNAPIEYDKKRNGYYYNNKKGEVFELPGLWFNASELYALLISQKLLQDVQAGIIQPHLQPLLTKIEKILKDSHHHPERISEKVKILHQAHRATDDKIFQKLSTALLEQQQVAIHFYNRATNIVESRNISPLRLIYYRDNWYLDAWCHKKEDFRTFSIINVKKAQILTEPALIYSEKELNEYYASAYGIFSGEADKIAILHFTAYRARWVADENWHPQQKSKWLENGDYELQIPYSKDQELLMDILKYGADVTVVSPPALVTRVKKEIENNLKNYT